MKRLLALLLFAAPGLASAQSVALAGQMGSKALLVIDGQSHVVAVGDTVRGVRLVRFDGDSAVIERNGAQSTVRAGAPVNVGGAAPAGGNEVVMTAGPGGHFVAGGTINGRSVTFMVDTGATFVSIPSAEADRIGLDYRNGQRGVVQTANGAVGVYAITLSSLKIGGVETANVQAIVTPAPMSMILLGNSYLTRFQMRRENDVMRLERR